MRNKVVFLGGGTPQLYKVYNSTGSQDEYGTYEEKKIDERVTDSSSSSVLSNKILAQKAVPTTIVNLTVIDSNFIDKKGYNIESFKVGDKVILNTDQYDDSYNLWGEFTWGKDYWLFDIEATTGVEYVIKKIKYNYDECELELDFNPLDAIQRIEDIQRDLTNYRFKDAPDTPN